MAAVVVTVDNLEQWILNRLSTEAGRKELANGFKVNECALRIFIHDGTKEQRDWSDDEKRIYEQQFKNVFRSDAQTKKSIKIICDTPSQETLKLARMIESIFYFNSNFSYCFTDRHNVPILESGERETINFKDFEYDRLLDELEALHHASHRS